MSVPVYVLTSNRTFSGGEDFTNNLKVLKRGCTWPRQSIHARPAVWLQWARGETAATLSGHRTRAFTSEQWNTLAQYKTPAVRRSPASGVHAFLPAQRAHTTRSRSLICPLARERVVVSERRRPGIAAALPWASHHAICAAALPLGATTTSALAIVTCALSLLGRANNSFPPIRLVETVPVWHSPHAEAFVTRSPDQIVIVTRSDVFIEARRLGCVGSTPAIRKIASILVHEEAHLRDHANEETAYAKQLQTLSRLNLGPGTQTYRSVEISMRAVARSIAKGVDTKRMTRRRLSITKTSLGEL
jgi:hypothetical protein